MAGIDLINRIVGIIATLADIEAVTDAIPDAGAMSSIAQETTLDGVVAVTNAIPDAGAMTSIAQEATLAVPDTDSAANTTAADVGGNKNDTHDGTSTHAIVKKLDEHVHTVQLVYPTLADGVALATAADDWVLGTITEIVPANAITSDFDIHEIVVEAANTADKTYELHLFSGAGDTLVGKVRFAAGSVRGGVPNVNEQMPIIAANARIRGQLAIQDGGSKTAVVSIRYHTY